ncbi:MAG: ribonuclease D [Candidatus Rokuibacteriota bacterium]
MLTGCTSSPTTRASSHCVGGSSVSRGQSSIDPASPTLDASAWSWVRTKDELERLVRRLALGSEIALDTEGDSLHHYPPRLSLVQIGVDTGEVWLVDSLALPDLGPLAPILAEPARLTVVHAGDNDLVHLKRRQGLRFTALFDTSIAARFLGLRALGLDVLLVEYLGVQLPPSRQRDDWSARPLSLAQERYAAADVQYLIPLKNRLVEELGRVGRLTWVEEECQALAADPALEPPPDPEAYASLKGARELSARGLAALRALYQTRERLALETGRPPFKIISNETLLLVAAALPRDVAALGTIAGFTPRAVQRWGPDVLVALEDAFDLPETELPVLIRSPRPQIDAPTRRRFEALRAWRSTAAPRLGLDPGVVLPNRLIGEVAGAAPRDRTGLARVAGLRHWRAEALGDEILDTLARASSRSG